MENNRNASDSEDDSALDISLSKTSILNGPSLNEPDTNATLSQRVFHAAKDGMALTLFALLADQARPQQVARKN